MLCRLIFAFAALCGSAQALFPDWVMTEAVDKVFKELEEMSLVEHISVGRPHNRDMFLLNSVQDGDSSCGVCVMGVTRHIMGAVMDKLWEVCETTECPFLKKKCAMAKEHPKVAAGYLYDHVQVHAKSYAYCYGRRACPHPGAHECCCGEHCTTASPTGNDFGTALEHMGVDSPMRVMSLMTPRNEEAKNETCVECIEGTAGCVMEGVVHWIKAWCEKTECPCMKRRCEWAMAHREYALGALIHRVRPGEWGCGYCFGKGVCKFPSNATMSLEPMAGLVEKAKLIW